MLIFIKNLKLDIKAIIAACLLTYIALPIYQASAKILEYRAEPDSGSKRLRTDPNMPMRFSGFPVCPGSGCFSMILAEGIIQLDTVIKFKEFLKNSEDELGKPSVCFNSLGGNLEGGIALGREIRKQGLDTCVLNYYTETEPDGDVIIHAENSVCLSACVFAFLGGVSREIEPNAKIGVHQISGQESGQEGNIGDSETQFAIAEVSAYLDEIGVDRRLLDIASMIPPKEKIPSISLDSSKKLKLDNIGTLEEGQWLLEANEAGIPYAYIKREHPTKKIINTTLIVWRENQDVFLRVINNYDIKKDSYLKQSDLEICGGDDENKLVYIMLDNQFDKRVGGKAISCKVSNQSVITLLKLDQSLVKRMLNSQQIELDFDLGNAGRHLNPNTPITLKGFSRLMKVVLR